MSNHDETDTSRLSDFIGHKGTQIAAHFLTRSTIQTAIVLATGMGATEASPKSRSRAKSRNDVEEPALKKVNAQTFKAWAAKSMLGALQSGLLDFNIVELDLSSEVEKKRLVKTFGEARTRMAKDDKVLQAIRDEMEGDWQVDLVLTPLDGATALRSGYSGSVSAAAAGPRNCFNMDDDARKKDEYFVIAIGKELLNENVEKKLDRLMENLNETYKGTATETTVDLKDFLASWPILDLVLQEFSKIEVPPIVGLTLEGPYDDWAPTIKPWHRKRRLDGSTVATALATYTGKIPCSMFASRRPQVIQAAIAAKGLGGRLYAIPLPETKIAQVGKICRENDFVKLNNAVLCCTSVSEVCALDRVRFGFDHTARTNSVTVSLVTGRVTNQSDLLDLNRSKMRRHDGSEVQAMQLLSEFKDVLHRPQIDGANPGDSGAS